MLSRRSPLRWLFAKEWRELLAARAFWVMLLLSGPLVGVSFISAVTAYAELSAAGGSSAGVGEAFSPLIGVFAPTFSAYEIVAAFLLPFVAIRLVSSDRMSGAFKLEAQQPLSPRARVTVKALVLLAGWLLASIPGLVALVLWRGYGGAIHGPEIVAILVGHMLNAGLTIALAAAAASLAENPSTAAILTLAFTVGTWVLSFVAAIHGGLWEQVAAYTPPAIVAQFQHGLVRLDVVLVVLALIVTGLVTAAQWMRIGASVLSRAFRSLVAGAGALIVATAFSFLTPSVDLSENRYNSFSRADEAALRSLSGDLAIEVHLAPEDPRRYDLDRNVITKLRRVVQGVRVTYVAATSTGLFEQATDHYGEILYTLGGKTAMSREIGAEGVLDTLFSLASIRPGADTDPIFRGHPLAASPRGAATTFYLLWPALVVSAFTLFLRSQP